MAEEKKKKKKINKMKLEEIEEAIKKTQEKMGGLTSVYAKHLLKRREELLKQKEAKAQNQ
jgi:hypothetical protein